MRLGRPAASVVPIIAAVLAWPTAASAQALPNAALDRPTELRSHGAACATGADRSYARTSTPVLAARQSDPDAGQQSLTTTFIWWRLGAFPTGIGWASQDGGNPSAVSVTIPADRLVDGATYAWLALTYDGSRYGPWSARCEFTVDVTPPPAPAGVTSTDYPADGPHGGVGVVGQFIISPPVSLPDEVVAYVWTLDSGAGPGAAATIPADPATHGAILSIAPVRDNSNTLRVWSKDRAGNFSTPVTWTFTVARTPDPDPPPRPQPPSVSFPSGNTVVAGGTLPVRLDANGDESVTEFRYSVDSMSLNLTAVPDQPGGSVTVAIPVGTLAGERQVFAVASTGTVTSPARSATFEVLNTTALAGTVFDATTFLPVEGASVRLEPGGHQTITTADGTFAFSTTDVSPGVYTLSAEFGTACSSEIELEISGSGVIFDLYLFPDSCEP